MKLDHEGLIDTTNWTLSDIHQMKMLMCLIQGHLCWYIYIYISCVNTHYQTPFIAEIMLIGSQTEVTLLHLYLVLMSQF